MSLNKSKSLRTAEKYVLQGKIPAAIDEYRKVVDSDPSDLTTINTLGDLYVRAGRIPDAIQNFSKIADSYRDSGFTLKAIAMLKKISKLDPTNIDTAMKLANLYSQQGLFVEARQQYLQVADAYARAGQTRKALEAYQKIADLDPSNTAVRMKLGDIYSREGMVEQAHEAFVMAGAEFSRRNDNDQALNANLKALAIQPDSRQALTAIVNIYTQQGQAERAINILCDAFEKNPGDTELLTILGRTYLAAGWMDEAEKTFLSLVELDRNRYHYLLEVGRKFLQMGELDRAAEQIDGCMEVLISKREEDKAIEFLRRVLDKDMHHVASLKRLADIFMRIREDHNLIATLNTLAEAAMRKGSDEEAIVALQELCRLEPDEQMHRQRLYNLGVKDIAEPGAPDVIRATGPLDYGSAAFDDAFIIRQISEAEILAGHGQIEHALMMLKEILMHAPDNIQVHLKLKDVYIRTDAIDQAAAECLELSRIYDARGEATKASDYLAEAQQLNPLIETPRSASSWPSNGHAADSDFDLPVPSHHEQAGGAFEMRELTGGLDLSRYETGALGEQLGFVTLPAEKAGPMQDSPRRVEPLPPQDHTFRYSDTLMGETGLGDNADGFAVASDLPSDTMPGALRDELEGVDFYIAQGYVEIAHDTLDRLREEHGEHPEILARYKRLGISASPTQSISLSDSHATAQEEDTVRPPSSFTTGELVRDNIEDGSAFLDSVPNVSVSPNGGASTGELLPIMGKESAEESEFDEFLNAQEMADMVDMVVDVQSTPTEDETRSAAPFLIQKESAPLNPDLLVKLNTTDLFDETSAPPEMPAEAQVMEEGEEEAVGASIEDLFEEEVEEPAIEESVGEIFEEPEPAVYKAVEIEKPERISISGRLAPEAAEPRVHAPGTAELIESLISGIDDVFGETALPRSDESVQPVQPAPEESQGFAIQEQQGQAGFETEQETREAAFADIEPESEVGIPSFEESAETGFGFEDTDDSAFLGEIAAQPGHEVVPASPLGGDLSSQLEADADDQLEVSDLTRDNQPEIHFEPGDVSELNLGDEQEIGRAEAHAQQSLDHSEFSSMAEELEAEIAPGSPDQVDAELRQMLEELKGSTGELNPVIDYETHYSLGLAYKDMDLLDDAIEQFQLAFRMASLDVESENYIQCCHMLGFCFKQKVMPKLAIMWFQRGLKAADRTEDEYQALRFEIGLCYEEMGAIDKAIETFSEVYGVDVNYRHVGEKLKELQALKNA